MEEATSHLAPMARVNLPSTSLAGGCGLLSTSDDLLRGPSRNSLANLSLSLLQQQQQQQQQQDVCLFCTLAQWLLNLVPLPHRLKVRSSFRERATELRRHTPLEGLSVCPLDRRLVPPWSPRTGRLECVPVVTYSSNGGKPRDLESVCHRCH
jgi:hypothetical protein